MQVRLLKDVRENGQVKSTLKARRQEIVGWFAGKELEVSDATGAKLIERGDAEQIVEVTK